MSAVPASARRCIHAIESAAALRTPLWQADQLATPPLPACTSGFAALDAELPGGGWPASGLTELLLGQPGSGEIRLLAPALQQLAASNGELVCVAPPYPPYAPALQAFGLPLQRLLWLSPATEADAAWSAEQVLRSRAAGAVLWWSRAVIPATLRRLHLAAQGGATPLFALRPDECRQQSSPAPLRLAIEPLAGARLQVRLLKRRGPALDRPICLQLPSPVRLPYAVSAITTEDAVAVAAPALAAA